MSQPGHAPRQFLRAGDRLGAVAQEVEEQRVGFGNTVVTHRQLAAAVKLRQAGDGAALAVHVPAELGVVGQQQVGQRLPVTLELPPVDCERVGAGAVLLYIRKAHANVFGFNVADGQPALLPADGVIGRAALDPLGFVGGRNPVKGGLQQRIQRRPVGVLGGVALRYCGLQLPDVFPEYPGVSHGKHP